MNAIALCHNRDLQKTNGGIIVGGSGSISLMQTATWVNMQPCWQSECVLIRFDWVMVLLPVCLSVCTVCSRSLFFFFFFCTGQNFILSRRPHVNPICRAETEFKVTKLIYCFQSVQPKPEVFFPPLSPSILAETRAPLCSLLTVKSWENCPENPEQKGV